jgi:hypothetical protein
LSIRLHRLLSLYLTELLLLLRHGRLTVTLHWLLLLWYGRLTVTLHWLLRLTELLWHVRLTVALNRLRLTILLRLLSVLLHARLARLLNRLIVRLHRLLSVRLHWRWILIWLLHSGLAGLNILGLNRLLGLCELLLLHRLALELLLLKLRLSHGLAAHLCHGMAHWWTLHRWLLDINSGRIARVNKSELLLPV